MLSASFRSSIYKRFHSKAQLRWIGVGLWVLAACAGRSTKSKFPTRALSGLLDVLTQGRAGQSTGQGRAGQEGTPVASTAQEARLESASLGGAPQTPTAQKGSLEFGSLGPPQTPQKSTAPTAERSIAEQRHYGPRIPGGFTLPHRPMQMVSGALGSFGFRV